MSRCKACDKKLTEQELKTRQLKHRHLFEELCLKCRVKIYGNNIEEREAIDDYDRMLAGADGVVL